MFGVNTHAVETNRLAVKADTELLSHVHVTDVSGNARKVINETAGANTASEMFQNGFDGPAEFVLICDNAFRLKVSDDGADWRNALTIAAATDALGIGCNASAAPQTIDTRAFPSLASGLAALLVTGAAGAEWAELRSIGEGPNAAF